MNNRSPGWDQKEITRVTKEYFGDDRKKLAEMLGADLSEHMLHLSVSHNNCERYGSVEQFSLCYPPIHTLSDPSKVWPEGLSVFFTSFWGWDPSTWGTIGFTGNRGLTRRENLLSQLTDPFISVCYVTSNQTYTDPTLKGMIAGFYLVSHETGDRDAFTHPVHYERSPEKWRHSVRAIRAFSYLPETRISARDFDADVIRRARTVSAMGTLLTDQNQIGQLRHLPYEEVEVYSSISNGDQASSPSAKCKGIVTAGPASHEGYVVSSGSQHIPRELYILRLVGDTQAYLGYEPEGRDIFKIGLSASPDMRRQAFEKAMPRGTYSWAIERTTCSVGIPAYPNHKVAVEGEYAMKRYLAKYAEWLGGEFYLASSQVIETAWQLGCETANGCLMRDIDENR